jgi:hypothetical protein
MTDKRIAEDPAQVKELDAALAALGDQQLDSDGVMRWEYLIVTATVS